MVSYLYIYNAICREIIKESYINRYAKTLCMNKIKIIKMLSNHSKADKSKQEKKRENKQNIKCQF